MRRERICPRSQSRGRDEPRISFVVKTQTKFCRVLVKRLHIRSLLFNISFLLITSKVMYYDYSFPVQAPRPAGRIYPPSSFPYTCAIYQASTKRHSMEHIQFLANPVYLPPSWRGPKAESPVGGCEEKIRLPN